MREVRSIHWVGKKIKEITFSDGFSKQFSSDLILLQCSGVKDSFGKFIYEGDILKHDRIKWICQSHSKSGGDLSNIIEIYWDDKDAVFRHNVYDEKRCFASGSGVSLYDDRAKKNITKIMGNVYENKNLLPKGK